MTSARGDGTTLLCFQEKTGRRLPKAFASVRAGSSNDQHFPLASPCLLIRLASWAIRSGSRWHEV